MIMIMQKLEQAQMYCRISEAFLDSQNRVKLKSDY